MPTPGCSTARRRSTSKPTVPACAPITTPDRATVSAPLRVEGLQLYKPELVARYNRVVQGQPYREERLNALQTTLQATPYFASAQASIDRARRPRSTPTARHDGAGRRPYSASGAAAEFLRRRRQLQHRRPRRVQLPPCQPARPGLGAGYRPAPGTEEADRLRRHLPAARRTLPAQQHRRDGRGHRHRRPARPSAMPSVRRPCSSAAASSNGCRSTGRTNCANRMAPRR